MLKGITLDTLSTIDEGRIKAAVDLHLKKLTSDCIDRPGCKTPRKLKLELFVVPQVDPDTGQCDDVNIEFDIGSKVPNHRSRPVNCKVRKTSAGPLLLFNDLSEGNVNQRTLDEAAPAFVREE